MFYTYIMASRRNGTLYTGSTTDLTHRAWQHRNGVIPGFSKDYGCKLLVWWEAFEHLETARHRERCIKEWRRDWKLNLIETMNPEWRDLYLEFVPELDL